MTRIGLIRRNLARNRLRTALTAVSIAVSIFLVCGVLTLPEISLEGITRLIMGVGSLTVVMVVFVAANSCSMSIRERANETAILKAIGFGKRWVLLLYLAEALALAAVGGSAGAVSAYGLLRLLSELGATGITPALGPLSLFVMTTTVLVQGLFLSLVVGIAAGIIPAWGAARRTAASSLREIF